MGVPDEHFQIEEIAPGVHAAIATARGYGLCNATIVDLGGSTLVFDAMLTPQAGTALGLAARRLTGRAVDFLVNSHYHGDHVRGNGAVGAQHIVSTHRVRELILERAERHLAEDRLEAKRELEELRAGRTPATPSERAVYEGWFEGILATPAGWTVVPPDLTITEELVIRGSRREARVLTYGGGHSPSDVLVHLPDDGIVLLGDLVSVGFHPSLSDGDPEALVGILGRVRVLRFERAVPGHGPMGGPADVRRMEEYVRMVLRLAAESPGAPPTPGGSGPAPPPPPFDTWKFRSFFASNLAHAIARRTASAPGTIGKPP